VTFNAGPAKDAREDRRLVTVLFCDVVDSSELVRRLDPETFRSVMERYFQAMREVLEEHGGLVEKFIGDAIMAVFGLPQVHEDDALRAVRAATRMRSRLAVPDLAGVHGVTIVVRTGIASGEVVAGDGSSGQLLVTGEAVITAARLEQAAPEGEILIAASTAALVRKSVTLEATEVAKAKGIPGIIGAYRVMEAQPGRDRPSWGSEPPFLGRRRELRRLRDAFNDVIATERCAIVTVLGPAGVGKSRLVHQALEHLPHDRLILRGRCLPYGRGITYWPWREILRQAAGITEADQADVARRRLDELLATETNGVVLARRVAALIGMEVEPAPREEIFAAVRRTLAALAATRPLAVVVEDVHWAEPTLLDLIEYIAASSRDAPIILIVTARPELLDSRPGWGGGRLDSSTTTLDGLGRTDAASLLAGIAGSALLTAAQRDDVLDAAAGNPLFIEEMAGMLVEQQDPPGDGRTGHAETAPRRRALRATPLTIEAILAARIDALSPDQRIVLEAASVVGRVFERDAVATLVPAALRMSVTMLLDGLVERDLMSRAGSGVGGDAAYRFHHELLRDAAYRRLTKRDRAYLHERVAQWVDDTAGDRSSEYDEVTAFHLEQAARYRRELEAPRDPQTTAVAVLAAQRLAAAGRRATSIGDLPAAANLLGRAMEVGRETDLDRAGMLADLRSAVAAVESARPAEPASNATDLRSPEALVGACRLLRDGPTNISEAIERCEAQIRQARGRTSATLLAILASLHLRAGHVNDATGALSRAQALAGGTGDSVAAAMLSQDAAPTYLILDRVVAEAGLRHDLAILESGELGESAAIVGGMLVHLLVAERRFGEALAASRSAEALADATQESYAMALWQSGRARALAGLARAAEALPLARHAVESLAEKNWPARRGDALLELARVGLAAGQEAVAAEAAEDARALFAAKGDVWGSRATNLFKRSLEPTRITPRS